MAQPLRCPAPESTKPESSDGCPAELRRTSRATAGGTGTLIGIAFCWFYQEHTHTEVPAEVAAAIGGIFAWALSCLDDAKAFLLILLLNRRR